MVENQRNPSTLSRITGSNKKVCRNIQVLGVTGQNDLVVFFEERLEGNLEEMITEEEVQKLVDKILEEIPVDYHPKEQKR